MNRQNLHPYALKIYSKQILTASRKKSILREIRLLQLCNHKNIIKIYDALETNNHVNLLLELVSGTSLSKIFRAKPFPMPEAKNIIYQMATTLNYLHKLHISHRDIKLENVLYMPGTKQIKLIDFGFSTLFNKEIKKKMFCGTPSYMAPEIVSKIPFKGYLADVWALGVMTYALVTQNFPFKGHNDKELYLKI